ncbi:hypothetical protein ACWDTI_06625 [Gordonia sp. NPDC003424]
MVVTDGVVDDGTVDGVDATDDELTDEVSVVADSDAAQAVRPSAHTPAANAAMTYLNG